MGPIPTFIPFYQAGVHKLWLANPVRRKCFFSDGFAEKIRSKHCATCFYGIKRKTFSCIFEKKGDETLTCRVQQGLMRKISGRTKKCKFVIVIQEFCVQTKFRNTLKRIHLWC